MVLERDITLVGSRGRQRCRVLFDSGASYSLVRPDIAAEIAAPEPLPDPENWVFETARAGLVMQATHACHIEMRFDDSEGRFTDEFIVLDGLAEEAIVGATTMQKWRITLDFESDEVHYRKTAERLRA